MDALTDIRDSWEFVINSWKFVFNTIRRQFKKYNQIKRPSINNQIRSPELRVIDEEGKNLGVLKIEEALRISREKELDLIEISPKANPPVAKIMEYGKYLYQEKKKEREGRKRQKNETKGVRFTVRTSGNDITFRAEQVDKFLKKGYRVRIQMIMKGREKALKDFANERLQNFLGLITEQYKIDQEPKRSPVGMFMVISKK